MLADEMDQLLASMLDDHRISRAERRALRELVQQRGLDDRTLALFRSRAFDLARAAVKPEDALVIEWLENAVKSLLPRKDDETDESVAFSPGRDCLNLIVSEFRNAKRRVDVCVFTISDDRIVDAIIACRDRGIAMRIITDDDKSTDLGSDVRRLDKLGINVRMDASPSHMHHKFAVFDDERVLTGSYNWTRSAAERNHENVVVTDNTELVVAFRKTFTRLWDAFG